MDTTFYEDSRFRGKEEMRGLKRPMTLDLESSGGKPRGMNTLLTSPDLNMLKLGSPELEKLIMAQHSSLVGGPQQCMYPPSKSDDYGREFNDALTNLQHVSNSNNLNGALYQQQHQADLGLISNCSISNNIMPPTTMVDSYGGGGGYQHQQPLSSINMNCNPMPNTYAQNGYYEPMVSIKEEPQTVPCLGGSPPQSPIDMEDQERQKLERKRLRNRIAASKCRRRKLERIARLEDKVANLKNENAELVNHVTRLRDHICQLKQQVLDHVRSGCEILVSTTYPTDL